ncbi:hypothetical protein K443DRAFT_13577 [Laccaria amethystina LaAM-08-1]|uniref:Uncharacterized protein n=1 Tax=Laccaria amethystina LaAM-08-1 TaxID=1095629 RepID=A0A0C9X4A1_9AGAR|nr:hypothetical protein K443DRAFT_13577 [Laccaria amethystina LaAM-08-1]
MQRYQRPSRSYPTQPRMRHYMPYAQNTIYVYNDPTRPRTHASKEYARRCIGHALRQLRAEQMASYWVLFGDIHSSRSDPVRHFLIRGITPNFGTTADDFLAAGDASIVMNVLFCSSFSVEEASNGSS